MELEEEITINHLQESTPTVSNDKILENYTSNGNEIGKEVSESNTHEEKGEESSVAVSKLGDTNPSVAVTVGELVEEDFTVQPENSESNGCRTSVASEATGVLKDEQNDDEAVVNDEIATGDVAAEERGGSDFINPGIVDGGECEADVIVRDDGLVEENVKLSGEDTDTISSLVIGNDRDGVDVEKETVKVEEDGKALKVGGVLDVPTSPVAVIGEREEVMMDAINKDGGVDSPKENAEIVQGDETIIGDRYDVQRVDSDVVHEKGVVADDEEALCIGEGVKTEGKIAEKEKGEISEETDNKKEEMADEEKAVGVTENAEGEPMVADEKSLDSGESDEEPNMADEDKVPSEEVLETESTKSSKGKRKRGQKNPKSTPKPMSGLGKMTEEDVCFICFDGGDLVLCDQRNCPKAYHPSCVNRDDAFFQTKGKWNCGWHLCSNCGKKAEYMCYTCTFSLCKACIKTNFFLCVREKEKKGFCEACIKTVMLIEKNSQEDQGNVDFDDKNSWEYLFKDYWTDMKAKLNLSFVELVEAMNDQKGSELAGKQEPPSAQSVLRDDGGSASENPSENLETKKGRGRLRKKRKSASNEEDLSTGAAAVSSEKISVPENTEWASKELLEFVMHMDNGDKSFKSQFDVQALLLKYIKTNNLRDPRRKTHIICDAILERLFGKPRVGHFEMLKLLESHFLIKEDSEMDDMEGSVVDSEYNQVEDDETNGAVAKSGKDKKRKTRKKGDREPQSNHEDYAAIDIHNINLIYLRRKLVEDLLKDTEAFCNKVVGMFVRIRISGANQKHDLYRLVPVTGTTKVAPYTLGKKTTDIMLEILNLDKTESVSIDTISNQDFTEDECKRLRQSIKCGLIKRLTVGDILDKAMELHAARVNDSLEAEVMRLSHLRDRASDLGRKKELRECVEKLQVLKTPEERARRLEEFPVIHADPTMDPNYGSEDDTDEEEKKQDMYKSSVGSRFNRRQDYPSKPSWSETGNPRTPSKNYELSRSLSNNSFSVKTEDASRSARLEPHINNKSDQGRDTIVQPPSILKKPSTAIEETQDISETSPKMNETEKMWHYKDPSGKIQGPFSMTQLRKWSNNKFFPADLRIWKSGKEDDDILLTDALEGRFTPSGHIPQLQNLHHNRATTSVEIPKPSPDERNLPSPTPNQGITSSYHGRNEGLQSPTPSSFQMATSFSEQQNSPRSSQSGHFGAPQGNSRPQQMVPSGQRIPVGPYDWSGGPPQHPLPSPPSNVTRQQPYNQWGNAPNFLPPSAAGLQQSSMPPQQNVSWSTVHGNQTVGQLGNQSMNWGQGGQLLGNVNPQWGMQVGVPGWVPPPPAQGTIVSGNGNPNWVGTSGNQGASFNPVEVVSSGNQGPTSSGWVGGPGNQGSMNSDMGWASPTPRNRSTWEGSGSAGHNRNRDSGSRWQWDRQGSFNN